MSERVCATYAKVSTVEHGGAREGSSAGISACARQSGREPALIERGKGREFGRTKRSGKGAIANCDDSATGTSVLVCKS